MKTLLNKMAGYDRPQMIKKMGIYPYYHPIESGQDAEVLINGKGADVWLKQLSGFDQSSETD